LNHQKAEAARRAAIAEGKEFKTSLELKVDDLFVQDSGLRSVKANISARSAVAQMDPI